MSPSNALNVAIVQNSQKFTIPIIALASFSFLYLTCCTNASSKILYFFSPFQDFLLQHLIHCGDRNIRDIALFCTCLCFSFFPGLSFSHLWAFNMSLCNYGEGIYVFPKCLKREREREREETKKSNEPWKRHCRKTCNIKRRKNMNTKKTRSKLFIGFVF